MFSKLGYDFFMMDSRGHGQSGGKTVHVPSVDAVVDDVAGFSKFVIKELYSPSQGFDCPPDVFISAHSFGCMQLLNLLLKNNLVIEVDDIRAPIKAVSFTCPFWDFGAKKSIAALL